MEIKVSDMSCGHCTSAIEKAVMETDPAAVVACDLETKVVSINTEQSSDKVIAAIRDIGFEPELLE